jgi:hypothetical protein
MATPQRRHFRLWSQSSLVERNSHRAAAVERHDLAGDVLGTAVSKEGDAVGDVFGLANGLW